MNHFEIGRPVLTAHAFSSGHGVLTMIRLGGVQHEEWDAAPVNEFGGLE